MSDSIRACEERINDLTEQINAVNDRLAELKEQMLAVQQSLESTFFLAFRKKKELRAELDVLTGREKTLLEQRRVLQDKLANARYDKVMAEEAAAQAIIEAQKRAEAELARIIAEEQARNKAFKIQDGVLIKYTGDDTDVTIPDGVTSIGEKAFESSNVRNVVIPYGVTSIGDRAFAYCWKLESIKLPETLTEIGKQAFTCAGLKDIVIPDTVTRIGSFAFSICMYLEHIKLPISLTDISRSLFSSCHQLERIVIPENIKEIGMLAFNDCSALESFAIPEGVKTIKYHTFKACSNLVHIVIPASVTEIDKEAFEGCKKLVATVQPGSYAEKFCRKGRIRYFYSDGSAPVAPTPHAEAKPASSTLAATNAVAKTSAASVATMKAKKPTPARATPSEQSDTFDLSQVSEHVRPQLSRLLNNLLSAYPDKVVSGLSRDHGHWAETLTKLYKELGYTSGQALLETYGFTVKRAAGGRPANDQNTLIAELKKRYPQPWTKGYTALLEENEDLRGRLKTLSNKAQALFGMSLRQYLHQEGILGKEETQVSTTIKIPKSTAPAEDAKKKNKPVQIADEPVNSVATESNKETVQQTASWKSLFTKVILGRGMEYFHAGQVGKVMQKDDRFSAIVSGSLNYCVSIQHRGNVIISMSCECPYAEEGMNCKHEAALLHALEDEGHALHVPDGVKGTGRNRTLMQSKVPYVFEVPSDLPEVWDAPVYHVEEINVTGDETGEWEFAWQRRTSFSDERELWLLDYLGDREKITLPAYINGQKVEKLGTLKKCRASHVEIPGSYGTLTGCVVHQNDHIETLVIGEGIREISADIVDALGAKNKVKNLLVSASVTRVTNDEIYRGSRWKKYVQTPWRIIGSTMAGYGGNATTLRIPHGVKTISYIGRGDKVRNIVLPDSVTAIYDGALASQRYLTQFEYTSSLNHMGKDVFNVSSPWYQQNVCDGLLIVNNMLYKYAGEQERIVVPQGVTKICQHAFTREKNGFTNNDILKEVILPNSVESVEKYGFYYCTVLEKVHLAEGMKTIGECAFMNCFNLTSLQLPDSLETLGDNVFDECRKLTEVQFGGALQTIGAFAFANCGSLPKIRLPQRLKSIGESAFSACKSLDEVHIPQSVERVGDSAFSGCSALRTVSGLQHLTEIGKHAFDRCASLEDITLPAMMGDGIAHGCTALRRVVLHPETEFIPDCAFENCTSLEEVVWPEKLCKIGWRAFKGCTALRRVELPATLQEIEKAAFQHCAALEHVVMPADVVIAEEAFTGTPYQKKTYGDFVVVDGKLIKYQGQQTEVVLPDDVRIIGEKSFAEAWHVEKLLIGDQVSTIEGGVFGYTKTTYWEHPLLKELIIGEKVEKIGCAAFANCSVLSNVVWGGSVYEIDKYAFEHCPITTMDLSKTKLQVLTDAVFKEVRAEKINFPTDLKRIEADAFKQASYLRSVDLSDTQVTYIGDSAFAKCISLKKVAFPATLTMIMGSAFVGAALGRVELPANMVRTDSKVFGKVAELVVYDNLITSDHTQPPEDGRTYWFGHSKHAIEALLTYPENLNAEQRDSLFDGSFLTVKDSQTEQIKYRIYINKAEREELREEFKSAWQPTKHLDFSEYDKQFLRTWNVYARIEMAFCRLQYPYELSEQYQRMYEAWLERCLFIESSATRVAEVLSLRDDISYLELLERYHAITPEKLPLLTQIAEKHKAKKCYAWLKDWAAGKEGI